MSVSSINVWGVTWFKNASAQGGAQNIAIQYRSDDEVVIHSHTKKNGRMWGCCSPAKLLELIAANHGIFEIMTDFPQKVYFDLDKEGRHPEYREWAEAQIAQILPGAEMVASGSITDEKTSVHVVVQNYAINNETDRKALHLMCDRLDGFDGKVYTKNRNMKCVNQSKLDGRLQAVYTEPDLRKHLITCFQSEMLPLPIPDDISEEIVVCGTYDMSTLPRTILPDAINVYDMKPIDMMNALPITPEWQFKDAAWVMRFAYYNDIKFGEFLNWAHKKHTDDKKWEYQWARVSKYPPITVAAMVNRLTFFYPNAIKIKEDHFQNFKQTFDLPPTEKVETLTPEVFACEAKFVSANTGMGSGKTQQTCDYLKGREFIWIAPIIALARNLTSRIDATFYKDIKHKEGMNEPRLLICMNSLHYVDRTYDTVVIDESETVLMKWMGDFMNQQVKSRKEQNWEKFVQLIRSARRVILLDAFTSTKTINLMKQICDGEIRVIERVQEPTTRTVVYVKTQEQMIERMLADLAADKKVFCYYPQKHQTNSAISMAGLHALLTANGKKGVFYNSEVDEKTKAGLQDVNAEWADIDVVITNNTMTCGVNFDDKTNPFDTAYVFIASYTMPRDAIQVSYRPRILTSNTIFVNFMGKQHQREVWADDSTFCPIYRSLYLANLLELKAPNRKTFAFLCAKANYTQTTDDAEFCEEQAEKIRAVLDEHKTGFAYHGLENISDFEAERIKQRMFMGTATMVEKYTYSRHFFRKPFRNPDLPEVEIAWEKQWIRLSAKIRETQGSGSLFARIAQHNQCDGFPVELEKVKLTPALLDEIFENFKFTNLTRESKPVNILRHIYNEHFGTIYKTEYGTGHVKYVLEDGVEEFYSFVVRECRRTPCMCATFKIGAFGLCTCGGFRVVRKCVC